MSTALQNFAILGVMMMVSCGKPKPGMQGPAAIPVSTQKIAPSQAIYYDEYPATITALNQVDLRPQVNGYITGLYFKEGDHVKKGDKLYSIDQQQYEAAYQQTLANVAVQQANLERAEKDVNRYRELNKHDAVAKQLVDNAE